MLDTIAELAALEAKAEPAPWRDATVILPSGDAVIGIVDADGDEICNTGQSLLNEPAHAALIVAMRNALPELLHRYETDTRKLQELANQRTDERATANARAEKAVAQRDRAETALAKLAVKIDDLGGDGKALMLAAIAESLQEAAKRKQNETPTDFEQECHTCKHGDGDGATNSTPCRECCEDTFSSWEAAKRESEV